MYVDDQRYAHRFRASDPHRSLSTIIIVVTNQLIVGTSQALVAAPRVRRSWH